MAGALDELKQVGHGSRRVRLILQNLEGRGVGLRVEEHVERPAEDLDPGVREGEQGDAGVELHVVDAEYLPCAVRRVSVGR